jgi:ribonuclease BN (tRNA processing enzyme)
MIEVVFLGVGEAFDETLPNTSVLIRYGQGTSRVTLLLDCGFTAPPQFWKEEPSVDSLNAIWISHFHADHFFGLPALLVRFWEDGRNKPLTILGQKGIDLFTRNCLDLAYSGFYDKIQFPIKFQEVEPNQKLEFLSVTLRAAENEHSKRDLALRLDAGESALYYSGDGRPTPESMALAKGSQLIIHEAFRLNTEIHGHGTVRGSVDMAKGCEASSLALVHIQRGERIQVMARVHELKDQASPVNLMVPEPGDKIVI